MIFALLAQGVAYGQTNGRLSLHATFKPLAGLEYKVEAQTPDGDELAYDPRRIINEYETAPKLYADNQRELFKVAVAYGYFGETDKLVAVLKLILDKDPDEFESLNLLGIVLTDQKKYDEAARRLKKSWTLGYMPSLAFLGSCYAKGGKTNELERLVPTLLENRGKDPTVIDVLVAAAKTAKTFNTNLFLKAVEGVRDDWILQHPKEGVLSYIIAFENAGRVGRARALVAEAEERDTDVITILVYTPEQRKALIGNYEKDQAVWKDEELLAVAVAYAYERKFEKAEPLYNRILKVKPNCKRALRGLGCLALCEKKYLVAQEWLEKSWKLGDVLSLRQLALAYLGVDEFDEVQKLIPEMLKHKKEDIELVSTVAYYAANVSPPDKRLFDEVMEGIGDEIILSNDNVPRTVIQALRKFRENERANALEEKLAKQ